MKYNIFGFLACLMLATTLSAQTTGPDPKAPGVLFFEKKPAPAFQQLPAREHMPVAFETWRLDFPAIQARLKNAPVEFTAAARQNNCVIALPESNGVLESYAMVETAIMAPELAAKYPDIRTYSGVSLNTPGKILRITSSMRGLRAMILRPDGSAAYVEPLAWGQTEYYIAFEQADLPVSKTPATGTLSTMPKQEPETPYVPPVADRGNAIPVELRVLRFAATGTGEFCQDHGGTKETALAAVVEYTNMASAAYERDIAIRLQLVGANDKLMFLDPDTDPYTGDNGAMAGQNVLTVNTLVGFNNFDIGHVLRRGGGGVSLGLGIACTSTKAAGCTAGFGVGDYGSGFVGVLGQETGHQLDGPHTWNSCGGDANGQRSGNSAFEPGSGSTIMSYAGGCGSDNVQNFMDLYYHSSSIEVIRAFVTQAFNGNGCGTKVITTNNLPTVTLPYRDGFYIPTSTPFELIGTATDPDGDNLSYCWEEMDAGDLVPLGQSQGSSALFRTRAAVNVPIRVFPRLNTILNNTFDPTELLPDYSRDMNFRLTVRDNKSGGGGVSWANVSFQVDGNAGPFEISAPNTIGQTWQVGEFERVTWKVANTDKAPVNCQKVNIRLSLDNGLTFPILLAENTDNDGSQYVLVPNNVSNTARLRVEAADNIFFDINNRAFRIAQPTTPTLSLSLSKEQATICLPAFFKTDISAAGTLGFSNQVTLSLSNDLPPGATVLFSNNTLVPGETVTLKIDFNNATPKGNFTVKLFASAAGVSTIERELVFHTITNDFSGLTLKQPADGANVDDLTQTLRWNLVADAERYDVQLATSPAFNNTDIVFSKTGVTIDSFAVPILLKKASAYYWRVRPSNSCGTAAWTEPSFFSTFLESCATFGANDLPKSISSSGTPTVESKITVNAGGKLDDVIVKPLKFNHTFFKQLDVRLISPQGTEVVLFSEKCGPQGGIFNFTFTDDAPSILDCPPLPNQEKTVRPQTPLAAFKGQNSTGTWTLRVKDNTPSDGGNIQDFRLEFCAAVALYPPFLIRNLPLDIDKNANRAISPDFLQVDDPNNTHAQLVYTLITVPQNGHLEKNMTGPLKPGDTFTQADIDAGALRYFDAGFEKGEDSFRFSVSDGEGGFFGTPRFVIKTVVGTEELNGLTSAFRLYPNPAASQVWVAFDHPMSENIRVNLFNITGQLIQQAILPAGSDRLNIELEGLPKGVYFVRVQGRQSAGVRKLSVE